MSSRTLKILSLARNDRESDDGSTSVSKEPDVMSVVPSSDELYQIDDQAVTTVSDESQNGQDSDDSLADPTFEADDLSSHGRNMQVLSNLDQNIQGEKPKKKVKHPSRTEKVGKKRIAKPDQWIKNQAKRVRNSGQAYVSSSSKKAAQERKILPPCADKCRLKCVSKFSESDRLQIFENYWGLADLERQRAFLLASKSEIKPKYRYVAIMPFIL
nr:unnamed protein product [Callosobruchus analis]